MTWTYILLLVLVTLALLFLSKDGKRKAQLGQKKLEEILAKEDLNKLSRRYHSLGGVSLVKTLRQDFDLDLLSAKQLADKIQEKR